MSFNIIGEDPASSLSPQEIGSSPIKAVPREVHCGVLVRTHAVRFHSNGTYILLAKNRSYLVRGCIPEGKVKMLEDVICTYATSFTFSPTQGDETEEKMLHEE